MIRFTFLDPVNGYIELVLEDMDHVITQGWNIDPHMEPLRVRGSLIYMHYFHVLCVCTLSILYM